METTFPNLDSQSQTMWCSIGSRKRQRLLDQYVKLGLLSNYYFSIYTLPSSLPASSKEEEDMETSSNGSDEKVGHLLLLRPRPRLRPTNKEDIGFFSLSHRNFADIKLSDAFQDSRCCGYSHGWMVMVSDKEFSITLLNLFSNEQFKLPSTPMSQFRYGAKFADGSIGYVTKVVLSSPPTSKDCIIAVMGQQNRIALCKPRGGQWFVLNACFVVEDIVFYNGKLHVLDYNGRLTIYNLDRFPYETFAAVLDPKPHLIRPDDNVVRVNRYLVESKGKLLVVSRVYSGLLRGLSFHVFKVGEDGWIPVESLGDQALFVGAARSVSVNGVDIPSIRENCIYFTRRLIDLSGQHAVAAYCMEDKSIEAIPICDQHSLRIEPVWI